MGKITATLVQKLMIFSYMLHRTFLTVAAMIDRTRAFYTFFYTLYTFNKQIHNTHLITNGPIGSNV